MPKISFTKMLASGNDFVVIERSQNPVINSPRILARRICDRKFGIGADGLLLLEKSKISDIKMRIFNPDGSEAEMCGNGARCSVLYVGRRNTELETKAGIIQSQLKGNSVKIKLTNPANIKLDIPLKVNKRNLKANFIDIGVPHAVIFVDGLDEIRVSEIGRAIRNNKKFAPRGTNVDFAEVLGKDLVGIRTYERGVEDETLACGTGSVASSLIFALKADTGNKINVHTKSQEILKVYFDRTDNKFTPLDNKLANSKNKYLTGFTNVWLEGKAKIVYKGCWCGE